MTSAEVWENRVLAGGRYRVVRKLGEGGMGAVYQAYDQNLQTDVVIKVPHVELLREPRFARRFEREIRSLVSLTHPHIVKIQDVGEHDGVPFAVMQYLSGGSLERRMAPAEGVAPVLLETWLPTIAKALDFVHRKGYLHRDVKPANIFFDEENPYLGDFGIAKVAAERTEGLSMGTLAYMAPEMFMPPELSHQTVLDGRIDQYALASTVYEFLSGRISFSGTVEQVLWLKKMDPPPELSTFRPDRPKALSYAVARGMAQKPEQRYASCGEFAEAVLAATRDVGSAPPPPPPPRKSARRSSVPPSQRATGVAGDGETRQERAGPVVSLAEAAIDLGKRLDLEKQFDRGKQLAAKNLSGGLSWIGAHRRLAGSLCFGFFLLVMIVWATSGGDFTNSIGMRMKLIPAGEFMMGSLEGEEDRDNDEEQHRVRITKPFYLGTTEVTQGQWEMVMGTRLRDIKDEDLKFYGQGSDYPMYDVSWYDAVAFCNKLSELEGKTPYYRIMSIERETCGAKPGIESAEVSIAGGNGYRLPTEAEWEYACRAGATTPFHFGSVLNGKQANCDGNNPYGTETKGPYLERTTTIGSYSANGFGLHDMHGNVREWCSDWYDDEYYANSPTENPNGASTGSSRVSRGGSWFSNPRYCRSAIRYSNSPGYRNYALGFRIAIVPSE